MITFEKYTIKEYPTCRVGHIVHNLNGEIRNILKDNKNSCLKRAKSFPGTVGHIIRKNNKKIISFCPHNITHIDRPEHIYADSLIDFYEEKIEQVLNRPHRMVVCKDNELEKDCLRNNGERGVVLARVAGVNRNGFKLFSDEVIQYFKNYNVVAFITNCLSVDTFGFPANLVHSNHFRLMSSGILIIEAVPVEIIDKKIKNIVIKKIINLSGFRDADPVQISVCS